MNGMTRARAALSLSLVVLASLLVALGLVGSRLHVLEARTWHKEPLGCLSFSEDDSTLLACSSSGNGVFRVSIVDRENPLDRRYGPRASQERTLEGYLQAAQVTSGSVVAVVLGDDSRHSGPRVAVLAYSLLVLDRDGLIQSRGLEAQWGGCVALSPSGRLAAFFSEGTSLTVIDSFTEQVRSLDPGSVDRCLAFSNDGTQLVISNRGILGKNDAVEVFRVRDGARLARFELDFPSSTPASELVASVLQLALAPRHHVVLQLLRDGPNDHRSLRVWSVPDGKDVTPKAPFKPDEKPTCFALSHETDEIAIGFEDGHFSVCGLSEFLSK
jgi:WD40 repeat protein